jgi:N-acetyl-anhydromuramyl-L-alanine amidase AmpD
MIITLPPLKWAPSPNFRKGRSAPVRLIIAHDEEGSYDGSTAQFLNPDAAVSAHFAVRGDGLEVTQYVALGDTAWHVRNCNPYCVGVEMPGFAAKGFPAVELDAQAIVIAWLLHHYNLPTRWAQHGEGEGFCSHYDLHGVGGNCHTDPTQDPVVWQRYVARVSGAYTAMATGGGFPDWAGLKL